MNTPNPFPSEQANIMALDGASLLLHRALNKLVSDCGQLQSQIPAAARDDFNNFGNASELYPRTSLLLTRMRRLIEDTHYEMEQLHGYWMTLQWPESMLVPDPRVVVPPEVRDDLMQAVNELTIQHEKEAAEREQQAQPTLQQSIEKSGLASGPIGGEISRKEAYVTAVDPDVPAPTIEDARIPGGAAQSIVGPPSPDFDPALLASKKVTLLEFKNDVRHKHTLGKDVVEPVIAGNPVLWLQSEDGTRVAIKYEDIQSFVDILTSRVKFADAEA